MPNPDTGKRSIVFHLREGFHDMPVELPCGKCIHCRLEHSRQMAVRCVHEASLYDENCFVTLTYSDENLPSGGSIEAAHPVSWMKRLRARFPDQVIRSYGCAEYGDQTQRPHYHILLFNFDFPDKKLWRKRDGYRYYRSEVLEDLWKFGNSEITDLTFESAAYVARYVTKKMNHGGVECTRVRFDEQLKRYIPMEHERSVCVSRRPGIGRPWLDRWACDVYPLDRVVLRGQVMRPPSYYNRIFELRDPEMHASVKAQRKHWLVKHADRKYVDDGRWHVLEECKEAQFKLLKRGIEI